MIADLVVNEYFDFLITDYNFKTPVTYNYAREVHTDYIKENIIVKIIYEGAYWCELIKLNKIDKGLLTGEKMITDMDYNSMTHFNLSSLDPDKKFYNSVSKDNFPDKELWYYSMLLKNNPEILNGDFSKFSIIYRLLKKIGLK